MKTKLQQPHTSFSEFFKDHYLADHQHPANVALHIVGTLAGLGLIGLSLILIPLWWALLFPIVHAAPGLIGHRLFDRDDEVGDVRLFRTDFPLHWFIVANHILTAKVLTGRR